MFINIGEVRVEVENEDVTREFITKRIRFLKSRI